MTSKKRCAKTKKKHVAIISYFYHPYLSGLSEALKGIAESLTQSGVNVDVYVTQHQRELRRVDHINGVKIIRHPIVLSLDRYPFSPHLLINFIRHASKYTRIIVPFPFVESGIISLFIPSNRLLPYHVCDAGFQKWTVKNRILTAIAEYSMDRTLRKAKLILVISLDYFIHSRLFKMNYVSKAIELPPPVVYQKVNVPLQHKDDFRQKYCIPKCKYTIGFLGRITFEKGLSYLLKSIPKLKEFIGDDFVIVIGGDYKNLRGKSSVGQITNLLRRYRKHVRLTGFLPQEDKPTFYSILDVFCLPSIDPLEAFGIVQVEAMIQGVPVVASNLPGVREIIKKTKFGKTSRVKNPESIASAISDVLLNKDQLSKNKTNWSEYYSKDGWDQYLRKIIKI